MKYYNPKKCCQYCNLQFKNKELVLKHEKICESREIMEQIKRKELKPTNLCRMLD